MKFPDKKFRSAESYASSYFREVSGALAGIDTAKVEDAANILYHAICNDRLIFSCGNGGSAAIANHLVCDCGKGVRTDTSLRPRVFSLSNSVEMLTAISNDFDFRDTFSYQLQSSARSGDVLITISSSGDSENIVRAIQWAITNEIKVIAMSGFSGGRSQSLADVSLHVPAQNYGVVEDAHQSLMHVLAQYLRHMEMPAEIVGVRKF